MCILRLLVLSMSDLCLQAPLDETIALFRSAALQRVVSRAVIPITMMLRARVLSFCTQVYAEMYEESLWECMQGNDGCSDMVKAHEHSLEEVSAQTLGCGAG